MKHIKLFEDYTEDELRDLQDDLHGIGHKSRFIQGEDFGFGKGFKEENSGETFPSISGEMFRKLFDKGEIIKTNSPIETERKTYDSFGFKNDRNFGIEDGLKSLIYGFSDGSYIIQVEALDDDENPEGEDWIPILDKIIKALGQIRI
jgi:hypothetical protein